MIEGVFVITFEESSISHNALFRFLLLSDVFDIPVPCFFKLSEIFTVIRANFHFQSFSVGEKLKFV